MINAEGTQIREKVKKIVSRHNYMRKMYMSSQ